MKKFLFVLIILSVLGACSIKEETITEIKGGTIEEQMIEAYNEGVQSLEKGDVLYAAKKFNEAELLYPQSEWAPKSSLMASYAYWSQGYYNDSIKELERFISLYPKSKNLDYANYLLAMNYYDSIVDEKKDLKPLEQSKKYFQYVVNTYPDSDYALDSKYKLDLIQDILAAKEMYIARHYLKSKKWIPAINRFKNVVENYETTVYVEEALHRLVETYYIIGLDFEANKYASLLGYNYQSSEWYKATYKVFNRDYEYDEKKIKNLKKQDKKSIFKKFSSKFRKLFE